VPGRGKVGLAKPKPCHSPRLPGKSSIESREKRNKRESLSAAHYKGFVPQVGNSVGVRPRVEGRRVRADMKTFESQRIIPIRDLLCSQCPSTVLKQSGQRAFR